MLNYFVIHVGCELVIFLARLTAFFMKESRFDKSYRLLRLDWQLPVIWSRSEAPCSSLWGHPWPVPCSQTAQFSSRRSPLYDRSQFLTAIYIGPFRQDFGLMSHSHLQDNLTVRSFAVQFALKNFFPPCLCMFPPLTFSIHLLYACHFLTCSGIIRALSLVSYFLGLWLQADFRRFSIFENLGPLRGWTV